MVSKQHLKSLRFKLIVWTFVPSAIILATIALVGIYAYGQVVEAQIISNGRENIRITATRLETQLAEYEAVLTPLTRTAELASDDPPTRQAVLQHAKEQLSVFDGGVAVVNTRGQVVAAGPALEFAIGQDWAKQEFFQKMVTAPRAQFSQLDLFNWGQRQFAIIALPILKERGEFAGVLVGAFNLSQTSSSSFYGSIVKLHIAPEKTVYLVDSKGVVLFHSSAEEIGKDYSSQNAVQLVKNGNTDSLRTNNLYGQPVLVSFAPVPGSSWGLLIEQSWANLMEPGLFYWRTLLVLLLAGLLLPVGLVAINVRKVTEPIWILNEAASQITAGNLAQEVQIHSGDELEILAQQFNQMTCSLVETVETLQKTNRYLQALRQCNQALVHASQEGALLNQICQIFVDIGGYQMAWVGYAQHDAEKKVLPVAKAGSDTTFLDKLDVTWGEDERGQGSVGTAIRERHPIIIEDIQTDPRFAPWRTLALSYGYRSVISLPLIHLEDFFGVIVIYATTPHAFDQAEEALFDELAKDLAFGIASLRMQAERERTDAELAKYRDHLEELVKERTMKLAQLNQDLIVAKEAAEAADRIKSAFLATMSHELRTPLNSIIGFTGVMMQGLAGPLNEEQSKQLGFVQASASHLLELINDVLDISKIEAGQLKLVQEKFNLRQSLEKVVQIVTPLANKKNLPIHIKIDPQINEVINDRRRVEQVVINLLNNAIKFTENGYVEVICQANGQEISLSVCDTGIGIRPEQIEKIFKPFSQVDTGLTRKYEGTGLGLSISKKLVEKMGGTLTLESQWEAQTPPFRSQGVGSTFTVTLPREIGHEA
jgi:signal transduction histidine kinase